MNEQGQGLHQELHRVSLRYRRLLLRTGLAVCWLALAVAGLAALLWARGTGYAVPGALLVVLLAIPLLAVPALLSGLRAVRDPLWVARRIEKKFPDLDARLLAALEQRAADPDKPLGFLQQTVIGEAVEHARRHRWEELVSPGALRVARLAQWAMLFAFAFVLGTLLVDTRNRPGRGNWWSGGVVTRGNALAIKVEPEDTEVERGTTLLVMARFDQRLPGDVQLLYKDADGQVQQLPMSKSLNDPLFAGRLTSVSRDLNYAVRYGEDQTRWYKVGVFDYPDLKQADAKLKYPQYTGLPEKTIEDTRSVTAVEGTNATLTFRLNKPVTDARLVQAGDAQPVELSRSGDDPSVYSVKLDLTQSQTFRLQLTDDRGRRNKSEPQLALNVLPNRPPELKLTFPGRDMDVSPLEEMSVKAQVWDDFGVSRVGISYGLAGQEPKELVLAEGVTAKEKRDVAQLVAMEKLNAEPDELLSYHLWVEDHGPDGAVRRTAGDMFFAEVRPFDQIFRQGQQPAGGQQQEQQQGQSPNGQQAEQLAELQKQIINATWKLVRRETRATPTDKFVPDVNLLDESQASAKEKAAELAEKVEDPKSQAHVKNILKHMDEAIAKLKSAAAGPSIGALPGALASEQAAYQDLLKLRAREHEIVRGSQRQEQQQGGQSSAANRRQQQLNQLELNDEQNRYETQRAAQPQQENPQQRETRQVLNRLRELAQRQEDLNKQMRELQSALEQARDEQRREEIARQLARLRDQQQQMLRDTDELRDRMDQPENQQRMADSREQLEQTRENVRRASEALEQGMVPQASSAGARASEQLDKLREDFRRGAAGEFSEAMDKMRQEARELDRKQQELSRQLNDADRTGQRSLRDTGGRQEIADGLGKQKQQLEKLLEDMRQTIEQAETSEPLLSKQLYDTVRDVRQQQTDQALDVSRQLVERGFVNEAREAEADASKGVTRVREGVERAAGSVLGDEAEALRRARNELDALAQELDREIGSRAPSTRPTTGPGGAGGQLAQRNPTTRGAGAEGDDQQPTTQPGEQQADAGRPNGERPGEQRPGERGAQNGQQQARAGGEPGDPQQPGQGQRGQRGQRQRGEGNPDQPGDQQLADARSGRPQQGQGQQPGDEQQGQGQQPGQQQGEGQQPGQGAPGQGEQQGQARGGQQPGDPQGDGQSTGPQQGDGQANAGGLRQRGGRDSGDRRGDLREFLDNNNRTGGNTGPGGNEQFSGPLTGDSFREWSDRLRDVEEMVGDPRLRAEAARIRDRARSMRAEFSRHSKEPNWDLVREFVGRPLVELRDQVAQELLRREGSEALVPIDREPVPPEYADQVRRYYERLGGGAHPAPDVRGGRQ